MKISKIVGICLIVISIFLLIGGISLMISGGNPILLGISVFMLIIGIITTVSNSGAKNRNDDYHKIFKSDTDEYKNSKIIGSEPKKITNVRIEPGKHDHEIKKTETVPVRENTDLIKNYFISHGYTITPPTFVSNKLLQFVASKSYDEYAIFTCKTSLNEKKMQEYVSNLGSYIRGIIIVSEMPSTLAMQVAKMNNIEIIQSSEITAG